MPRGKGDGLTFFEFAGSCAIAALLCALSAPLFFDIPYYGPIIDYFWSMGVVLIWRKVGA